MMRPGDIETPRAYARRAAAPRCQHYAMQSARDVAAAIMPRSRYARPGVCRALRARTRATPCPFTLRATRAAGVISQAR